MIDAGIYSFKIEGRLKDIGYVKNITAYYRQELDKYSEKSSSGICSYQFKPNPEKSFNRGFTEYFLDERSECFNFLSPKSIGECIGEVIEVKNKSIIVSTDKELHNQDGMCFINSDNTSLEGFTINKAITINTSKKITEIIPNKIIDIRKGNKLYRNSDTEFNKLLSTPTKRKIGVNVIFDNSYIMLTDEDRVYIEYNIESTEPANNQQKMNDTFVKQFSKTGESDFYISGIKILSNVPFMPISIINNIRRECFDRLIKKRLSSYKRQIPKPMRLVTYYQKDVDYRANIHNKSAKEFYEKCGVTVNEMSLESSKPNRQIELMRCKHCIKYALNMCKSPENLLLVDEYGQKYPLKFNCKNCEMCVMSPMP